MPRVQLCSPSYRSGNDVIVHLRWNALHKHGGKQSGDINWSIITKPCPLSTQEVRLWLRSIPNVISYLTILVLEMVLNATHRHRPRSLINLAGSLYREAPSDEVSKRKSPWQQRRLCKRTTYILSNAAYAAQYKLPSSFTNSFTAKAVPYMLSSVLTDVMQMLPSAVNSHTRSNKYQYMFEEKLYITVHLITCRRVVSSSDLNNKG